MKIVTRNEGNCRVVALVGSADINASEALRESLVGAVESGAARVVCDLSKTDFVSSDALGILITAWVKARGRGGFVRLAGCQQRVREILAEMHLDRLFEVFPDVAQAAAAGG